MPTPSKFLSHRQRLIVSLLKSGCSRREVCRQAQISPKTLRRWLERGSRASEGTSARRFYEDCRAAEAGSPVLVALQDQQAAWEANPSLAWQFLERTEPGYARRPDPGPIEVEVVFGPTIEGGDSA